MNRILEENTTQFTKCKSYLYVNCNSCPYTIQAIRVEQVNATDFPPDLNLVVISLDFPVPADPSKRKS